LRQYLLKTAVYVVFIALQIISQIKTIYEISIIIKYEKKYTYIWELGRVKSIDIRGLTGQMDEKCGENEETIRSSM
jgi:hypothetical protein